MCELNTHSVLRNLKLVVFVKTYFAFKVIEIVIGIFFPSDPHILLWDWKVPVSKFKFSCVNFLYLEVKDN